MARLLRARTAGASSLGALMARLLRARTAGASSLGALTAWLANVSETHRYTGGP
jgi:hypothetical protein